METEVLLVAERADTDLICDSCQHEITEGEDFYYDQSDEETYCDRCAMEKGRTES